MLKYLGKIITKAAAPPWKRSYVIRGIPIRYTEVYIIQYSLILPLDNN